MEPRVSRPNLSLSIDSSTHSSSSSKTSKWTIDTSTHSMSSGSSHSVKRTNAEVSEMIQALPSNTKIVSIDFSDANSGLSSAQRKELIRAIAQKNKTTLEQVHIVGGAGSRRRSIRISHVAELLVSGLKVFNVRGVVLDGRPEDFAAFSVKLFQHRRLQEFSLQDFSLANKDNTFVDRVIQVLGLIPTLAVVNVEPAVLGSFSLEGSSLRGLLARSKKLRHLQLARFPALDPNSLELLAQTVKTSSTLQVLSLVQMGLKDADVAKLAEAIKAASNTKDGKNCVLEALDLSSNTDIGNSGCIALASGLVDNKSVRTVRLNGNKNITKKGIAAMASMLRQNETIQTIQVPLTNNNATDGPQQLHGGRICDGSCPSNNKRTAKAA